MNINTLDPVLPASNTTAYTAWYRYDHPHNITSTVQIRENNRRNGWGIICFSSTFPDSDKLELESLTGVIFLLRASII